MTKKFILFLPGYLKAQYWQQFRSHGSLAMPSLKHLNLKPNPENPIPLN